jgi:hypothetical protein
MQKKSDPSILLLKRILKNQIYIQFIFIAVILVFTKNGIYVIINLLAALISYLGFVVMTKQVNNYLVNQKGLKSIFLIAFLKLMVIALFFIAISKLSEQAFIWATLGISTLVLAIITEGGYQLCRSIKGD